MRRSLLCLSLVALSSLVPLASARIVETLTFADVKAAGQERLTLFHYSTDAKSAELVSMLEEAATQLQALRLPALERFSFAEVDCVKPPNSGECSAAGFSAGKEWLFTSTQASGIQAYTGARTASAVATHVHHKFLPSDPALVQTWKDEESFFRSLDSPRGDAAPVFLKFWEEWCTHCKALKQPFEQMAVYFAPQVTFMELECSRSELSKAFCARQGATSFPTLMLFDGEDLKQKYEGERTIVGVEEFFLSKLTETQFKQIGTSNSAVGTAGTKKAKTKQAKAASKGNAAEETETAAPAAKKSAAKTSDDSSSSSAKSTKAAKKAAQQQDESESDDDAEDEEEEAVPKKKKQKKSAKKKQKKNSKKQKKQPKKKTQQQIEDEEDEQPIEDEDDEDEAAAAAAARKKSSAKKQKQKKKAQRKQSTDDDEEEESDEEEEDEDEAPKQKKKQQKKKQANKKKQQAQKKKKKATKKKRAPVEEDEEEEEEPAPKPKGKKKKQASKQPAAQKKAAASTAGMTQAERRKAKRAAQAAQEADEHLHDEL